MGHSFQKRPALWCVHGTVITAHACDRFSSPMLKAASILGRILALCFALELVDVPVVCADEWETLQPSGVATLGSPLSVEHSTLSSLVPSGAAAMDQDCGCPCHQTFGKEAVPALPPPITMCERFPNSSFSSPPPPPADLFHPPQNLV